MSAINIEFPLATAYIKGADKIIITEILNSSMPRNSYFFATKKTIIDEQIVKKRIRAIQN